MSNNRQLFQRHLAQTSPEPMGLEIEKAEGINLYTPEGRDIIDLISGISVSSLGHSHPRITAAVKEQVDKHMHVMVYGELIQGPQVQLARKTCSLLGDGFERCFFVNSGSEAVEGAMKLAKRSTGRRKIISCRNAYHGSTHGALSLGSVDEMKTPFEPLVPEITHIDFNDLSSLDLIDKYTAAVIIEVVQGEAGIRTPTPEFIHALQTRAEKVGALIIADEIQTGMGRTGKWFAFEKYWLKPDIVVLAKAYGAGMPLGAFVSSEKIMHSLTHDPVLGHITTFGGHPVSCAAALEGISIIEDEDLITSVEAKGDLFEKLLIHPLISEKRRSGLMMALQLPDMDTVLKVVERGLEEGVMTDWFLYAPNCLRVAPPLTINVEEIKEASKRLLKALD